MKFDNASQPDAPTDDAGLSAAAAYLATLRPGKLPREIFDQLARLTVLPTIEVILFRTSASGETEVLLTKRPEVDTWAGQWHVTGTVLRASDKVEGGTDYGDAVQRILSSTGEVEGSVTPVGELVIFETERRKTLRGDEISILSYIEVAGDPKVGRFFKVSDIPQNIPEPGMVPHHPDFIRRAAALYEKKRGSLVD